MFNAIKKIRESSSTSPVAEAEGTILEEVIESKVKSGVPHVPFPIPGRQRGGSL